MVTPFGTIKRPHPQVPDALWDNLDKIEKIEFLNGARPLTVCKDNGLAAAACATTDIFLNKDSSLKFMHEDIWITVTFKGGNPAPIKFTIGLNPKFVNKDLPADCETNLDKYVLDSQRYNLGKMKKDDLIRLVLVNQKVHQEYVDKGVKFNALKGGVGCEDATNCQTTSRKIMNTWKEQIAPVVEVTPPAVPTGHCSCKIRCSWSINSHWVDVYGIQESQCKHSDFFVSESERKSCGSYSIASWGDCVWVQ